MTLDSRMLIVPGDTGTDPKELFDYLRHLVGATDETEWELRPSYWGSGDMYQNVPGQGLPAWVQVSFGSHYIEVSLDTTYGYRGENNASATDLHAWLMYEIALWLPKDTGRIMWLNEFQGTWLQVHLEELDYFKEQLETMEWDKRVYFGANIERGRLCETART